MPATVADISKLKESIRQSFRKACLKRLEGQEVEAVKILQEELPPKVREWKGVDENASGAIESLLADELARTESAHWVVRELEARQSILMAKLQLDLNSVKEKLADGSRQAMTIQEAQVLHGRTSQEISERIRSEVSEAFSFHKGDLKELPSKAELDLQIDRVRAGIQGGVDGIVGKVATTEVIEELLRENVEPLGIRIEGRITDTGSRVIQELTERLQGAVTNAFENNKGALKDLPSKAELDSQIDKVRSGVQGSLQGIIGRVVTTEILEELLRENVEPLGIRIEGKITDTGSLVIQEIAGKLQAAVAQAFESNKGSLKDLPSKAELDSQIDKVRSGVQGSLQGIIGRVVTTEILEELLRENVEPLDAKIGARIDGANSQLHKDFVRELSSSGTRVIQEIAEKLQAAVAQAFENNKGVLKDLPSKTELDSQIDKVRSGVQGSLQGIIGRVVTTEILEELLRENVGPVGDKIDSFRAHLEESLNQEKVTHEISTLHQELSQIKKSLESSSGHVIQEMSDKLKAAVAEAIDSHKGAIKDLPSKAELDAQIDKVKNGVQGSLKGIVDRVVTTEILEELLRENLQPLEIKIDDVRKQITDLAGSQGALNSRTIQEIAKLIENSKGALKDLPSKAELDAQIDRIRSGVQSGFTGLSEKAATTEIVEELLRENIEPLSARISQITGLLDCGLLSAETAEELLRTKLLPIGLKVDDIKTLSESVRLDIAKGVASLEQTLVKLGEVISAEAGQTRSVMAARMEQTMTATSANSLKSYLEALVKLEQSIGGVLAESSRASAKASEQLFSTQEALAAKVIQSVADESTVSRQGYTDAIARLGQLFSEELSAYEARETHKWADRQSAWSGMLEGSLKKSDLDAALWQAQNSIGDRVEGQLRSVDGLSADVRKILEERLQKLVTAEAFEDRLMASTTMLHDALSKAQQESMSSLQSSLERRLADATSQIYQRVSSLISFADWERITRETNAKLSKELVSGLADGINKIGEESAKVIERLEASQVGRSQASMVQLQAIRETIEKQDKSGLQISLLENLRAFSERIAVMMIEASGRQEQMIIASQKEQTDAQTQTLGMLSAQQQNFLKAQESVNGQMKKTLDEICARQASLENDLRAISATIDNRMRDQMQLHQAEMKALSHKLEEDLSQAVGKRLKNMKIITE